MNTLARVRYTCGHTQEGLLDLADWQNAQQDDYGPMGFPGICALRTYHDTVACPECRAAIRKAEGVTP
jgi:hypothetical protein